MSSMHGRRWAVVLALAVAQLFMFAAPSAARVVRSWNGAIQRGGDLFSPGSGALEYSHLSAAIVAQGHTILPGVAELTAGNLAGVDVFFSGTNSHTLSPSEVTVLRNFILAGGSLIVEVNSAPSEQAAGNAMLTGLGLGPHWPGATAGANDPNAGSFAVAMTRTTVGASGDLRGLSFGASIAAVTDAGGGTVVGTLSGVPTWVEFAVGGMGSNVLAVGDPYGFNLFNQPGSSLYNPNNEKAYLNFIGGGATHKVVRSWDSATQRGGDLFGAGSGDLQYGHLSSTLLAQGCTILPGVGTLTDAALAGVDVFFSGTNSHMISPTEAAALRSFIARGGALIVEVNSAPSEQAAGNQIMTALGLGPRWTGALTSANDPNAGIFVAATTRTTVGPSGDLRGLTFGGSIAAVTDPGTGAVVGRISGQPTWVEFAVGGTGSNVLAVGDPYGFNLFNQPGSSLYNPNDEKAYLNFIRCGAAPAEHHVVRSWDSNTQRGGDLLNAGGGGLEYSHLASSLIAGGCTILPGVGELTDAALAPVDVFFSGTNSHMISPAEAMALRNFIGRGGSLIVEVNSASSEQAAGNAMVGALGLGPLWSGATIGPEGPNAGVFLMATTRTTVGPSGDLRGLSFGASIAAIMHPGPGTVVGTLSGQPTWVEFTSGGAGGRVLAVGDPYGFNLFTVPGGFLSNPNNEKAYLNFIRCGGKLLQPTTTALASSLNPSVFGQMVTLTATVSPATATGSVEFFEGPSSLGAATLSGGSASLTVSSFLVGIHPLKATYGGDPDFATSTSPELAQTVLPMACAGPDLTVECVSFRGTPVKLSALCSHNPPGDPVTYFWSASGVAFDDATSPTPTGTFQLGATQVTLTVSDLGLSNTAQVMVKIVDTTPPFIAVAASPAILWPPNNKLVDVHATVRAADACCERPEIVLTSITPTCGGSPWTPKDPAMAAVAGASYGTPDYDFQLLAQKAASSGCDPTYTIVYTATDCSGNTAMASATVKVPHDMRGNAVAWNPATMGPGAVDPAKDFMILIPTTVRTPVADEGGDEEFAAAGGARPTLFAFDARTVDPVQIFFGNSRDLIPPTSVVETDADDDGYEDLLVTYAATALSKVTTLPSLVDDPVIFYYRTRGGIGYEVAGLVASDLAALSGAPPVGTARLDPPVQSTVERVVPRTTQLAAGFPNPTRGSMTFAFDVSSEREARLEIFDLRGALVRILADGVRPAGRYLITWDGTDRAGQRVANGVYLVRAVAGDYRSTRKAIVMK